MNTENIQRMLRTFVAEREWDKYHTPKNVTIALSVEVSELLEIFQWMNDEEIAALDRSSDAFNDIQEEFADSMVYLLRLADLLDIDIEKTVLDKLSKNIEKYPVESSRGDFVKYNKRES